LAFYSIISLRATVYTSSYLWLGESSKNSKAGLGKHLCSIEKTSQKSTQLAMSKRVYGMHCQGTHRARTSVADPDPVPF
jgi:hypothetical protein